MKKIVLLLSVTTLLIVSCEKEELSLETTDSQVEQKQQEQNAKAGPFMPRNFRLFFNEVRYPTGCVPFKGDCFPSDIVITPGMAGNVTTLFNAIEHGEQSAIQQAFINHSDFLINLLSQEMSVGLAETMITEVVNGDLKVEAIKNNVEKDGNTNRFMRFVSMTNQEQVLVLPFVAE